MNQIIRIVISLTAAVLAVSLPTSATAADRCVNPADEACYATIQEAVDAAATGDVITIYPRDDGSAYNEEVVVQTSGLTITGAEPVVLDNLLKTPEFGGVKAALSFRYADAKAWLKDYAKAKEFKADIKMLLKTVKNKSYLRTCPSVTVENCNSDLCGLDDYGVGVFRVEADNTTISRLTVRHADFGVGLSAGVENTTVSEVCFRSSGHAVSSLDEGNNGTVIRSSYFKGAARTKGIDIKGSSIVVEDNLLINAEGINVSGAQSRISRNAVALTNDNECVDVRGEGSTIEFNVLLHCDGSLYLQNASGALVRGNLMMGAADDASHIEVRDSDGVPENMVFRHNNLRLSGDEAVDLKANDSTFEGNIVETSSNDRIDGGICLRGDRNRIVGNLVRSNSWAGIAIEVDWQQRIGSADNEVSANWVLGSGTTGIRLDAPGRKSTGLVGAEGHAVVANTLIANNVIDGNGGEGVAIGASKLRTLACLPQFRGCEYDDAREEWLIEELGDWDFCSVFFDYLSDVDGSSCVVPETSISEASCLSSHENATWNGTECRLDVVTGHAAQCAFWGASWDAVDSVCSFSSAQIDVFASAMGPINTRLEGNVFRGNRVAICN
ncbi:MAG TPA: hypothetical protein DCG06_02655, partial [Deltaproteobacteria bacterium]|nr:hypothetical protein [Deltaproteobacteria bacterium]